jgi:hypothetical protein
MKISRSEKKMTREAMNRLESMRQKDKTLSQDPRMSYKRETIYTNMPWPLKLVQLGRTDIVIFIGLLYVLLFVAVLVGVYYLLTWLIGAVT